MIVIAGGTKYEISPKDILNVEAMAIKRKIGLDFQSWLEAMGRMDAEAVTALIWIAQKRLEPTTKYEDVSFPLGAVEFELNEEEKAELEAQQKKEAEAAEGNPASPAVSD